MIVPGSDAQQSGGAGRDGSIGARTSRVVPLLRRFWSGQACRPSKAVQLLGITVTPRPVQDPLELCGAWAKSADEAGALTDGVARRRRTPAEAGAAQSHQQAAADAGRRSTSTSACRCYAGQSRRPKRSPRLRSGDRMPTPCPCCRWRDGLGLPRRVVSEGFEFRLRPADRAHDRDESTGSRAVLGCKPEANWGVSSWSRSDGAFDPTERFHCRLVEHDFAQSATELGPSLKCSAWAARVCRENRVVDSSGMVLVCVPCGLSMNVPVTPSTIVSRKPPNRRALSACRRAVSGSARVLNETVSTPSVGV